MPTTPLGIEYPVTTDAVRLAYYYERLAVTADAAIAKLSQDAYFLAYLTGTQATPVDGWNTITFDAVASGSDTSNFPDGYKAWKAPRAGLVHFTFTLQYVLTVAAPTADVASSVALWSGPTSAVTGGEVARGSGTAMKPTGAANNSGNVCAGSTVQQVTAGTFYAPRLYISAANATKSVLGGVSCNFYTGRYVK